ncbi:MAG: ribonuclease R [Parachlamydiaceae bacterium]|nr:ribonuclease R [Parachlamydiaceae bacterium]
MVESSKKSKKKQPILRSTKDEKLFQNLLKSTEQFISGKSYQPLTKEQLSQRLSLHPQHEEIFIEVLNHLIHQGQIICEQERYAWKQNLDDITKGIIRVHPRGFGFVQSENRTLYPEDIFIPKPFTKNAVDGDIVEVLINKDSVSEKGPEGKVLAVLTRARTHLAGIIQTVDRFGHLIVYVPLLGAQQRVIVESTDEMKLKIGDRIVMEILDWGTKETETLCKYSHYLGHISDPSCDIYAAIEEYEIRSDFPAKVIQEAEDLGKTVSIKEIKLREDVRNLVTVTIDPDTAKDFDDAISLSKDENGIYHLGVHIADVSHYVRAGSALDDEASLRCNSTYFPRVCVPMLPGALSENLCSLKPNVNRLTVSVFMEFDPNGNMISHRIAKTVIKSSKRFTYKEAKSVLDGKKTSIHLPLLNLMVELCRLLKQKRYERGSIEFSLPELVVLIDDNGKPYETETITYDITHQMIEEFMLKANETVAWDLSEKGKNLTYRIHDVPAEENLRDFSMLAAAFGFKVRDYPTPQDLQKLFEEAGETPYSNYLASSYIRRMRLASYSPENIGHYGLSLTHYCHFTSPIRRYVDLVVHRILFGDSDDFSELQRIASVCSDQERISAKAESSVLNLKKLRLLNERYEQDPFKEYEAVITKVKAFGLYFEIIDLLLEGFIHISELGDDYFVFEEDQMRLRGVDRGNVFSPGNRITVMLRDVNFITQTTNWTIIENLQSELTPKKRNKNQKISSKRTPFPSGRKLNSKKTKEKSSFKSAKKNVGSKSSSKKMHSNKKKK